MRHAKRFGVVQRGQRIGGFARLRDGNDQRLRVGHRIAITVLAGDFDRTGNSGDGFKPVTCDETGVITGTAGDDQDLANILERRFCIGTQ